MTPTPENPSQQHGLRTSSVVEAIHDLLASPDLNLDSLDPATVRAVERVRLLVGEPVGQGIGVTGKTPRTAAAVLRGYRFTTETGTREYVPAEDCAALETELIATQVRAMELAAERDRMHGKIGKLDLLRISAQRELAEIRAGISNNASGDQELETLRGELRKLIAFSERNPFCALAHYVENAPGLQAVAAKAAPFKLPDTLARQEGEDGEESAETEGQRV